jgi:hypothetical protein
MFCKSLFPYSYKNNLHRDYMVLLVPMIYLYKGVQFLEAEWKRKKRDINLAKELFGS